MLLIKLKLFGNMLIAANSAALAIYVSFYLANAPLDYWFCLGFFLALRVILFMANLQMPLNDANVQFMSSERTLWSVATITVALTMMTIKALIAYAMSDAS